jgi:hypothetical protein
MRAVAFLHAGAVSLLRHFPGRSARQRRQSRWSWPRPAERLEPRWALCTIGATPTPPAVVMLSAATTDSKSVTIDYRVNQPLDAGDPLQFGVYRSSNGQFGASDTLVDMFTSVSSGGSTVQAAALDQDGQPASAVGTHQLTIPLPQGLPPYPEKPYVVVVADPGTPSATTDPQQVASFRTYIIGVVTHGGIEDPSWKHGPPWELEIADIMRHQGYDAVIAYNWVAQSSTPGAAIKQSPRLARIILHTASKFPASAPVDLQFIGHSEGTVVNTYAIVALQRKLTPQLKAGFIEDTLLDPHAASNQVPGQQYSVAGNWLGALADALISNYQGQAKDPPVFIPSAVDEAQVFYQHTTASKSGQIYNLWGQVPVKADASGPVVHYYNLTAAGATHSGNTGVALWYRNFVAPTLGDQAPLIQELALNGRIDEANVSMTTTVVAAASTDQKASPRAASAVRADRIYGPALIVQTRQPVFSGTAAPGSVVRLYVGPAAAPQNIAQAGRTTADNSGDWSLVTSRPLHDGQYRAVVTSFSRALRTRPGLTIVPTEPLGRLVVASRSQPSSLTRYKPV